MWAHDRGLFSQLTIQQIKKVTTQVTSIDMLKHLSKYLLTEGGSMEVYKYFTNLDFAFIANYDQEILISILASQNVEVVALLQQFSIDKNLEMEDTSYMEDIASNAIVGFVPNVIIIEHLGWAIEGFCWMHRRHGMDLITIPCNYCRCKNSKLSFSVFV